MLARCKLLISIVETDGFIDYLHYLDPSFQISTRRRVKDVGLPAIKLTIKNKIKKVLHNLSWVNTSVDLWTDATTAVILHRELIMIGFFKLYQSNLNQ